MKRFRKQIQHTVLILLGIFSVGMGLKGFLLSSHFIDGGVTGISMLLSSTLKLPLAVLIPLINIPFIMVGYRQIGPSFALKSMLAILGLALCLLWVKYPDVTPDKLLTAVFGGLFIGAGIGLAIRGGAVLDGTDIVALLISKNSHLLRVGDVVLILNIIIFSAAAFFLGIEPALYSILTYFAASKMVDFLIHGIEEHTAVIIISELNEQIRQQMVHNLGRAVTVYQGRGGLSGTPQDILYCVVTRLEIGSIKNLVREIDPGAFIVVQALADAEGGMVKKPALH